MASEDEDKARRLAEALVDDLHGDLGAAFEEAAAAGAVSERFATELQALRATYTKRAPVIAGRDPFGEALRGIVSAFGAPEQIALLIAPDEAATPASRDDDGANATGVLAPLAARAAGGPEDAARVLRLRSALRESRRRVRRLEAENQALREELLSAGEMIETLALDLERPVTE